MTSDHLQQLHCCFLSLTHLLSRGLNSVVTNEPVVGLCSDERWQLALETLNISHSGSYADYHFTKFQVQT